MKWAGHPRHAYHGTCTYVESFIIGSPAHSSATRPSVPGAGKGMLRGAVRVLPRLRFPLNLARRPLCGSSAIDNDLFHRCADRTLEALQEVYDERADEDESLQMDVEYAVC